ncbi:MAG: hypothetical protein IJ877_03850 [Candidatus Gastranaerophilales bacterium]|nr:hypothetical protein [Candidatus Gastranaerophilales bacterium]
MSKKSKKQNSKFDQEIDLGKFLLVIFNIFLAIGVIWFSIWFIKDVYKPEERAFEKAVRFAYSVFQKEVIALYEERGYVFDEKRKDDDFFCQLMARKYAKNAQGSCSDFNPIMPAMNFEFKDKKITIYGLEKPLKKIDGTYTKDIIIDADGENKGDNHVGSDRVIVRIYSSGRLGGIMSPVNCSRADEKEYGMTISQYCIGSSETNYLVLNKPLGYDVEQIGGDEGKTRVINKNVAFIRADCTAFGGDLLGHDDYCSDKMLYWLKGCYEEYTCNIALTK